MLSLRVSDPSLYDRILKGIIDPIDAQDQILEQVPEEYKQDVLLCLEADAPKFVVCADLIELVSDLL